MKFGYSLYYMEIVIEVFLTKIYVVLFRYVGVNYFCISEVHSLSTVNTDDSHFA